MQPRPFSRITFSWAGAGCFFCFCAIASSAIAQIQVELKFPRLQLIAYEPVVANITITNLAGRDVILHDRDDQCWFDFEISRDEGSSIAQISNAGTEPL